MSLALNFRPPTAVGGATMTDTVSADDQLPRGIRRTDGAANDGHGGDPGQQIQNHEADWT